MFVKTLTVDEDGNCFVELKTEAENFKLVLAVEKCTIYYAPILQLKRQNTQFYIL